MSKGVNNSSDIISTSKIELKFLDIVKKFINDKIIKYIQIKNFNSIRHFYSIFIELNNILIINDASGIKHLIKFLEDLNGSNLFINKIDDIIIRLNDLFYLSNIQTYGMLLDSYDEIHTKFNKIAKNKRNYYNSMETIKIYDDQTYNEILIQLFNDFNFIKNKIQFNISKLKLNKFEFIINHKNIKYIFSFNIKIFNTISFIQNFIRYLFDISKNTSTLINYRENSFKEYKKLIEILYFILFDMYKSFDEIKTIFENYKYLNNNTSKKIRIIISFLLRFKMIGDQLQANEARILNNTYKLNTNNYNDYHRILTTQDRVLASYCMIEEDIIFVSKYSNGNNKYLLYHI